MGIALMRLSLTLILLSFGLNVEAQEDIQCVQTNPVSYSVERYQGLTIGTVCQTGMCISQETICYGDILSIERFDCDIQISIYPNTTGGCTYKQFSGGL